MQFLSQVGDSRSVLGKKKDESSPWESLELTTDHKPDLPKDSMGMGLRTKKKDENINTFWIFWEGIPRNGQAILRPDP